MENVQTEQQEQPQAQPVGFTLQDMKILAGAVELASQRGGFRAAEMEIIGATYNRLAQFLKANEQAVAEAQAQADAAAEGQAPEVTADAAAE
jgi:hypothetical protein